VRIKTIALLQALGVACYITLFAVSVNALRTGETFSETMSPAVGISSFLLAFVASALICATIVFGYPAWLFTNGKSREAPEMVGWTIAWFVALALIAGIVITAIFI
jgi:hypothetical protein